MRKRQSAPESTESWMDTYGDMVTLLLCFFVLLYSMSTVDQAKWEAVVKSFNPDAKVATEESAGGDNGAAKELAEEQFDELYEKLKSAAENTGVDTEVELYKGNGFTFVTFRDSVFFDANSSSIKGDGKKVLDKFAKALSGAADSIKEIQVLGHTTQASAKNKVDIQKDRVLSAERAAEVTVYLQKKSLVSPDKLIAVGYGQYRPIAPFDTEKNRAKNRRVELIITESDAVTKSLEEYYEEMDR